ncbi:serine palmitoyltransferase [Cryptococcus neoformans]|uniref:serine C-palmitoyltransferase n=2 Tax=Cryptococcus neoformans TaxID=5207 RepID=A0A854Q5X6_CRYNE|nr:serine palmitoyltransferase [Cryptococcus neoformans var. grubii H99]AUB27735.1 serine palmitoyltransferase [Cryptococcus neoformans var. grubii]OWT39503.1 serine palmitoyltransferase [Cryptococcus neoformans var. grubii Bt1]OWZ32957.1 serine palmitoyltransferase [Cryptococcus neoformans var. grubii AD1-83a]OWZ39750.1 serine palmitoyltransferase [Cryptococcus neoformans var. grubii C23]OWZ50828.1 serine palmitoyltransferase [Cryptococcus neoformans var. grubii 125.91]OWZ75111.1 serine palm|eukprot:XP_012052548.1 serine palmitoyltransferase [Cryptococcus neoformans var. grubii H99]
MGRTTRRSAKPQSGTSTPPNISSPPSRPLFPSISLRSSSPTPPTHENLSARSSLLSVLTRPAHSVAATPDSPEEELSDLSTVSSYASSVISGTHSKDMTEEEIAKVYENYLEKPFVQIKTTIKHSEFGHCNNPNWRWTSQWNPNEVIHADDARPSYTVLLSTYLSYILLIIIGHIRDFFGKKFTPASYAHLMPQNGYAALNSDFDSFYTRRLKKRLDDCFARPTTGVPGRTIVCYDRSSADQNNTFQLTGTTTRALNVSSYNYLGFASSTGGCADAVEMAIKRYGVASAGARHEASTTDLHLQCEKLVAKFLGVEASMVVSMGYATNSTTIPALVGKGCLVISDEFNHASIRAGVRMSGASMRWYKHNDMDVLENLLREVISQGQPRTHRPWKKILVIVEGLFSMEGSLVDLPRLIELKKRYKFYLYVDEAHSIGAMGPNGRGVCDYFGIDPREVDVLMGTVTKSFGAAGGYIAGTKQLVDRLRIRSHATAYAESVSPAVLTQIIASMGSIMGIAPPLAAPPTEDDKSETWSIASRPAVYGPAPSSLLPSWLTLPPHLLNGTEGRERLRRIAFNSRYLASGLRKLGFIVYGNRDSPIIPLLIFQPGKMGYFSRMMLERIGPDKTPIVVVVVAYPATPLITSRVRFCLSASHTKNDMDMVLRACDEVGDVLNLKYNKQEMSVEEVIANAEELVAASHV